MCGGRVGQRSIRQPVSSVVITARPLLAALLVFIIIATSVLTTGVNGQSMDVEVASNFMSPYPAPCDVVAAQQVRLARRFVRTRATELCQEVIL
jgi:hypothetical protein